MKIINNFPPVFVVLGPPLSGKGTQSELLAKYLNYFHFSLGDILRQESQKDEKVKKLMREGKLLPNKLVNQVFAENFEKLVQKRGVVIDGYPRNLNQAQFLVDFLKEKKKDFLVIYLDVRESFLYERLARRKFCPSCNGVFKDNEVVCPICGVELEKREDDDPTVLKTRLEMFFKNTLPVVNFFESQKKLVKVDGEKTIEEVFKEVLRRINDYIN